MIDNTGLGIGLGGINNHNGVRPGRRYRLIDTSKRAPLRTIEVIEWVQQRGRWAVHTVKPDGTFGQRTLILPDGLRKRYIPIGTE